MMKAQQKREAALSRRGEIPEWNRTVLYYLLLLFFHAGHVLEEVWGRFWIMNGIFGTGWFLAVNWALFLIPVLLFYFLITGKKQTLILSFVYALVMVVNGLVHNAAVLATGRYFNGFAGSATGLGLIVFSLLLARNLKKRQPVKNKSPRLSG